MTSSELAFQLGARTNYIDRHRPLLLQVQFALFAVGIFFYVSGITWPGVFQETTWGTLAYQQPAWFWGAVNAVSALITAIGLMKPVKNWMVTAGASLQIMQFGAIATSCLSYGGDKGIGLYAVCLMVWHCKMLYEAARGI